MRSVYSPTSVPESIDALRALLERSGAFDVERSGGVVKAWRHRRLPSRGFLRVLIPHTVVVLRSSDRWSVRPDGLALGVLVTLLGGIVVELKLDRVGYPRDYPPEFVVLLAVVFGVLLMLELLVTRAAVRRALATRPAA